MDTFMNEIDILCMECTNDVENILNSSAICYLEEGDTKQESFIKRTIDRIKDMIKKAIEKIRKFFDKKKLDDTQKKIDEAIKNNPSLKNKKVKVKDNKKIIELNKKTMKEIENAKSEEEVDKIMSKHEKLKAGLIGAAVIAVPLGVVVAFITKQKKEAERTLEEHANYCDQLKKAFKSANSAKRDYKTKNEQLQKTSDELWDGAILIKEKYNESQRTLDREIRRRVYASNMFENSNQKRSILETKLAAISKIATGTVKDIADSKYYDFNLNILTKDEEESIKDIRDRRSSEFYKKDKEIK